MHTCEFCNTTFEPRRQVSKPRACKNCQHLRQKANMKEWRDRNKGLYDTQYHQIKKNQRMSNIKKMAAKIIAFIETGITFGGHKFDIGTFGKYITQYFFALGVRKLKKLWI